MQRREERRRRRRRREEREERRDRDTEREAGEENGKVLSFFWMSQAQVRRRGRTNRKPGSGRKKKGEREREGEEKRDRAKERGGSSSDGLAGREHEDPKRGQRENDKGERGGGFDWKGRQRGLFPFTSVFSVLRSARTFRCSCARAH